MDPDSTGNWFSKKSGTGQAIFFQAASKTSFYEKRVEPQVIENKDSFHGGGND
jgi:hypothetical protein